MVARVESGVLSTLYFKTYYFIERNLREYYHFIWNWIGT